MVKLKLLALLFLLVVFSCNQENKQTATIEKEAHHLEMPQTVNSSDSIKPVVAEKDSLPKTAKQPKLSKEEEKIQTLIRRLLNWSNSGKAIDLLPAQTDSKGLAYSGFDMAKHRENLQSLRKTGLFANEFIDNYDGIILTLHKKLINKEFDEWLVNDLPTFNFANDVDVWCLCQDVPYDNPNAWDYVEVEPLEVKDNSGELNWKWGELNLNSDPGWKEFRYRFKVKEEGGKWKISYLEGFDFEKSTR